MRRLLAAAALQGALAAPAVAGHVLYVSAAAENRIDGYCLGPNGGISTTPHVSRDTVENPRRLLVHGDVLYVAGRSRVESFRIGPAGGLQSLGKTPPLGSANPLDIAVDEAGTHLYVPHRSRGRIEAHPLDPATGGLTGVPFTSCALTSATGTLQDLEVSSASGAQLLYATQAMSFFFGGKRGRIDVYPLAGGELPDGANDHRCDPAVTTTSSSTSTSLTTLTTTVTTSTTTTTLDESVTPPLSSRRKLRAPGPFVLANGHLYVYDAFPRKIIAFELANGLFTDDLQPRASATAAVGGFIDLVGIDSTLIAPVFSRGRVRAFALRPDPADPASLTVLPKRPQRSTREIIESTPVRLRIEEFCECRNGPGACDPNDPTDPPPPPCAGESRKVLYVAGGESNRVHAYRLVDGAKGLFPQPSPFSQTGERPGSFPNDVAIARDVACP